MIGIGYGGPVLAEMMARVSVEERQRQADAVACRRTRAEAVRAGEAAARTALVEVTGARYGFDGAGFGSLGRSTLRRALAAAAIGAALIGPVTGMARTALDGGASPATGSAQVIAQEVVRLEGRELTWRVVRGTAADEAVSLQAGEPGFLLVEDGALLTEAEGGAMTRLPSGEAMPLAGGGRYEAESLGDEATYAEISLAEADGTDGGAAYAGPTFDGGEGLHDLDLMGDRLAAGGRATLSAGEMPALIVVTEGEITLKLGDETVRLEAGDALQVDGDVKIKAGEDGAGYVAAVIGPELERSEAATPAARPGDEDGPAAPADTAPADTAPADTGPSTTVATPDAQPAADADQDGLLDEDEIDLGTDKDNPDSDADGLLDGAEVHTYGTDPMQEDTDQDGLLDGAEVNDHGSDPLSMDGDGDMLPDYNEVMQHGTDPMNPDTDGDGYSDHDELGMTDPLNPDTDGDGLKDGAELLQHMSDPLVTDTDMDGLTDGDEVLVHGSSPASTDTDADMLPDFNEVTQHGTDPANGDTDGDGSSDHDELGMTDPLDPDSDDDGVNDGAEIMAGTNPNDPTSK